MTRRSFQAFALLLPIVTVVALVARAEVLLRQGRRWEVRIEGYDPRDLLRGHYLRYRLAIDTQDSECASEEGCGVCLTKNASTPFASARRVPEGSPSIAQCGDYISHQALRSLGEYYIPEGDTAELESQVREGNASLVIKVVNANNVVVETLLIHGEPWRKK